MPTQERDDLAITLASKIATKAEEALAGLETSEQSEFPIPESTRAEGFADELIALIRNYRPIEIKGVYEELQETKRQLLELKTSLTDDKQWKEDFKAALNSHNQQLQKIIDGLDKEIGAREKGDEAIIKKLDKVDSIWGTFKATFNVAGWLAAAVAGSILTMVISHFWK